MKTSLSVFVITLLSFSYSLSASANVDCLRYMSKKSKMIWKKSCQTILEDRSRNEVESIDLCVGKFTLKGKEFFVINGDIVKKDGYIKKDVIISTAKIGSEAKETNLTISFDKRTASPELFKKYRHIVSYAKDTDTLTIQNSEGLFRLKEKYYLEIACE